jgi:hypothetical protein
MATFFVERNFDPGPGEGVWQVASTAGFGGAISTHHTKQAAINKARQLANKPGDDVAIEGSDAKGTFESLF